MKEPRIVNLDDSDRAVSIIVGGETFTISRITLEMRQRYGDYMIFCGHYLDRVNKINQEADKREDFKPSKLQRILGRFFPRLKGRWLVKAHGELEELIESFAIGKAEQITGLLSLILEKNGYKFKREWWEQNTDYERMEAFVVQALQKDEDGSASKKKATVS